MGKTRYTHESLAYHLVWIPTYRRRILVGEVHVETKRLMARCCERQALTLLAVETDEDHIHVFVSAPPRFRPALIANLLKGYSSRYLREKYPALKKMGGKDHLWTRSYDVGTAGAVESGNDQTVHARKSREVEVAFIPPPRTGWDFPLLC